MAKKKGAHQSNETKQQTHDEKRLKHDQETQGRSRQTSIEDPVEKLQNLKSLNALLLKEAMEKRQQIESLVQAKEALEAEFTRVGTERSGLRNALTQAGEENAMLELEKVLFWAFVKSYMREMVSVVDGLAKEKIEREREVEGLKREGNELVGKVANERDGLSRVCRERDSIMVQLELQVEKANGLREKLTRLETKDGVLEGQIGKLKVENAGLVEEKKRGEELIKVAVREKDYLERNLKEKAKEINGLKRDIEGIVREKKETEMEKGVQNAKLDELEMELGKRNEIVLNLRKEEKVLQERVFELEKSCGEATEKEKDMIMQINVLVKEKTLKGTEIEKLIEENNLIVKKTEMFAEESKDKEKLIDALSREKSKLEEYIVNQEAELAELNGEVSELRDAVLALQKDCKDREEKNRELIDDVGQVRDALTHIELERDNAEEGLDEERKIGLNLRSKVLELEKRIEETGKELEKSRNECESVVMTKRDVENQSESLRNEKDRLQKDLIEAKQAINVLKAKKDSAGFHSERALAMLKSTASLLCQSENAKEDIFIDKQKLGKDTEPYVAELEAIKKAFRNKKEQVEDMKKEVESMKHSVEQVRKRKSFWTILSTVLAVASVAYVARV